VARKPARGAHARPGAEVPSPPAPVVWRAAQTLELVGAGVRSGPAVKNGHAGVAVLCETLDEVRELAGRAGSVAHAVRAVLAPYIPGPLVSLLSAAGIAAIRVDPVAAKRLAGQETIALPAPSQWAEGDVTSVAVGATKLPLTWLASGVERSWATGASSSRARA
jgi:hypothetical protein